MTDFPSQPSPDWGWKMETQPRVSDTRFGDGYSQRVRDGLNTMLRQTTLTFTDKTDAEKDILKVFLEAMNGVGTFRWTPDGDPWPTNWYAPRWMISPSAAHLWKITVEMKEDPVV